MACQNFLDDGNLTPGIHEYTFKDFEKQFIQDFTTSETRKMIYDNFCEWLTLLMETLPPRYIGLDGSYLIQKVNPNDLDLVVFYQPEDIPSEETADRLKTLINQKSRKFYCDAYLCLSLKHLSEEHKKSTGRCKNYGNLLDGSILF